MKNTDITASEVKRLLERNASVYPHPRKGTVSICGHRPQKATPGAIRLAREYLNAQHKTVKYSDANQSMEVTNMTTSITIMSTLNQRDRRALDRFFDRAYDSNDYAATARRLRRSSIIEVALRDGLENGYSEVNEAHKLAKRAMVAIGRTFNYEINRSA